MSRSVGSLFKVLFINISNVLRETIKANFIYSLLSTSYCLAQSIAWPIIVIIFYSTKFKVLFLTFSSLQSCGMLCLGLKQDFTGTGSL